MFATQSTMRLRISVTLAMLSLTIAAVSAQQDLPEPNLDLLPHNAAAAVICYPQFIAQHPETELLPREIITTASEQYFGIDPLKADWGIMFVGTPQPDSYEPPVFGIVLHFPDSISFSVYGPVFNRDEWQGMKILEQSDSGLPDLLIVDDQTVLITESEFFETIISTQSQRGPLHEIIAKDSPQHFPANAYVDLEALKPMMGDLEMAAAELPGPLAQLAKIPTLAQNLRFHQSLDDHFTSTLIAGTANENDAQQLEKIISGSIGGLRSMLIEQLQQEMDLNDPTSRATVAYAERATQWIADRLQPTVDGDQLVLQAEYGMATVPLAMGMLLPAVQSTRGAAKRTMSLNNLRQLCLGILNYESAYQKLPTDILDESGRPLLSWRVQILPFMEEVALYEQFKLDEPWDSEHNIQLLPLMPQMLRSPGVELEPGLTVYQGVAGETAIFHQKPLRFRDITDGLSNTVVLVETNPDRAVEWTRPMDWKPDGDDPLAGLGEIWDGQFLFAFCDGAVQSIHTLAIDRETWQAMLTFAGSEIIGGFDSFDEPPFEDPVPLESLSEEIDQ